MPMCPLDQGPEMLWADPLRLEARHTSFRPIVDLGVDLLGRHLSIPTGTGTSEVWARVPDPRADLFTPIDPPAHLEHRLWKIGRASCRERVKSAGRARRCKRNVSMVLENQ